MLRCFLNELNFTAAGVKHHLLRLQVQLGDHFPAKTVTQMLKGLAKQMKLYLLLFGIIYNSLIF